MSIVLVICTETCVTSLFLRAVPLIYIKCMPFSFITIAFRYIFGYDIYYTIRIFVEGYGDWSVVYDIFDDPLIIDYVITENIGTNICVYT